MKKNLRIAACIALGVAGFIALLSLGTYVAIRSAQPESACRFYYESTVTIKDGALILDGEPGVTVRAIPFTLSKTATYNPHITWNVVDGTTEEPGFLTILLIKDSHGDILARLSGDQGDWTPDPVTLNADEEYTAEYRYVSNEKDFRALSGFLTPEEQFSLEEYKSFGQEGTWTLRHSFVMEEQNIRYRLGYRAGVLIALGIGILFFAAALLILIVKSEKSSGKTSFDERQEMIRGKAFKYGFFTMFAYYMLLFLWKLLNLPTPLDTETEVFLGIVLGLIPFCCYSVWGDAYFRMGDNKVVIIVLFALIGILNTALGLGNLCSGAAFRTGRISMGVLPLANGVMFLCLLLTGIIKTLHDRKEEQA